jgi:ABC-2 type transport system permease protein
MTGPTTAAAQTAPAGVIHDLAYRRYEGRRTGAATRFLVILRYAARVQFRQRSVKLFLLMGLMFMGIAAVILAFSMLPQMLMADAIAEQGSRAQAQLQESIQGTPASVLRYVLTGQWLSTFLLVLVCGAPAVAADLNAGAFQFHFARPVSVGQYLAGRLLGAMVWPALLLYPALVIYSVMWLAFKGPPAQVALLLAKGLLVVTLRLVTMAAVALGCSSLTRRRGLAQAMFAALVVGTWMTAGLVSKVTDRPWISSLDVTGSTHLLAGQIVKAVTFQGAAVAAPALANAAWIGVFLAIAWWRLARAEVVRG